MRTVLLALALFCCGSAGAQTTSHEYVFLSPGGETTVGKGGGTLAAYGAGLGGELQFSSRFGVGGDVTGVAPAKGKFADQAVGILSANGYYHFRQDPDKAFDPFVTAGYSVLFRDFISNGGNGGVGANFWFHEKVGFLLEGREHFAEIQHKSTHIWEVRIGLTFR